MRSTSSHRARLDKVAAARQKAEGRLVAVSSTDKVARLGQMYEAGVPRIVELINRAKSRRDLAQYA
jgi:uncharacterized pyridoxal phosphate-containing UPF0001 family protein